MTRVLRALLFLAAIPTLLHADCRPGKDSRKPTNKTAGIEVVDVLLSGASSVDIAELRKITQDMIGSCFDSQQRMGDHLRGLFQSVGYMSVSIEDLEGESLNADIMPVPVLVKGNVIEGQRCPTEPHASYQFLLDHLSDSLEVDPQCVDHIFASLGTEVRFSRKRDSYIKALVKLLDFERVDEDPYITHHFVRYPAPQALQFPPAVPYLVDAIKQTDDELARKNAVDALFLVRESRECHRAIVTLLTTEAQKPETTTEQKTRLQMAAEYAGDNNIGGLYGGPTSCKFEDGHPATEEQVLKQLDKKSKEFEGSMSPDD